jgi:hypothetical protein
MKIKRMTSTDEIIKSITTYIKSTDDLLKIKEAISQTSAELKKHADIEKLKSLKLIGNIFFDVKKRYHGIDGIGIYPTTIKIEIILHGGMMYGKLPQFVGFLTEKESLYVKITRPIQAWTRYASELLSLHEMEKDVNEIVYNMKDIKWEQHGDPDDKRSFALALHDIDVFVYYRMPEFNQLIPGMRYKALSARVSEVEQQMAFYVTVPINNPNILCYCDKYGKVVQRLRDDYICDLILLKQTPINGKKEKSKKQRID